MRDLSNGSAMISNLHIRAAFIRAAFTKDTTRLSDATHDPHADGKRVPTPKRLRESHKMYV